MPPNLSIENAISLLHDFETVIKMSPDCRGCKPTPPPKNGFSKSKGAANQKDMQFWEVEDDLPFIPKRLWSGGVKYRADFVPVADGCDITIYAPGGFTSTNHWRLVRDHILEDAEGGLERVQSKDMLHASTAGSGWYIQITSDAQCNVTYATFVKGFLKNTHVQLERSFVDKLRATPSQQQNGQKEQRRPTLGRRKSSVL